MNIRLANLDDAPALITLLSQLGYQMSLEQMRDRIEAFQARHHQLLVVEADKSIMAAIAFGCYQQLRTPTGCCHIDALIVSDKHRGRGLGKILVARAEAYAKAVGAGTVELISANHRKKTGTHAFYDSLGYQNHDEMDLAYFAKGANISAQDKS